MRWSVAIPTDALVTGARRFVTFARALAFWTAILLPLLYLPPLLLGHPAIGDLSVLGPLLAVNVVAIAVGHRHGSDEPATGSP